MKPDEKGKKLIPNVPYNYVTRPKALSNSSNKIRAILRTGNVDKLEKIIREGYGYKLIGEYSPNPKIKSLLKAVPFYMARIDMLHEAVMKGQFRDVQVLLSTTSPSYSVLRPKPENLVISKDMTGTGLLHKAVFYDYPEIVRWLVHNYPATVRLRDKLGRIPLHYANSASKPDNIWQLLIHAGSDINAEDMDGKTPLYYLTNETEIQLPDKPQYFYNFYGPEEFTIKPSNIRIWIHDQDINRLREVVLGGHGEKLKTETSNKPLMKKFLNGVPFMMGTIQEIHKSAISNDMNTLRLNTRSPVPPVILRSKDSKGVTPLHKASGLGHEKVVTYILHKYPESIHISDNEGRTPLHYAAVFKQQEIYDKLLKSGANEHIIDKHGKTAKCYLSRQGDIETSLLREIPPAPRTGVANGYPSAWDWTILNSPDGRLVHQVDRTDEDSGDEKASTSDSDATVKLNDDIDISTRPSKEEDTPEDSNHSSENKVSDANSNTHLEAYKLKEAAREEKTEEEKRILEENGEHTKPSLNGFTNRTRASSPKEKESADNNDSAKSDSTQSELEISIVHKEFNKIFDNFEGAEDEYFTDEKTMESKENLIKEIEKIIKEKNFEEMGNLILDGFGKYLLNISSNDKELREFISNMPIYLKKIELIHKCCEVGNIEELQKYLDRRKLAVAREDKTGLFLTPLHVAVLNNQRDASRYLGGRFPETFKAVDKLGRTPLHFAGIHPDGKYIYNMLLTLGADKTIKDDCNRTAEFYYRNRDEKHFIELLRRINKSRFKTSSLDSSADKQEIAGISKSDSEFLTQDLGKALKTGLSVVKSEKPSKPIKFLANYLNNYEKSEEDDEPAIIKNHPIDVQCREIHKQENDANFHNEMREETEIAVINERKLQDDEKPLIDNYTHLVTDDVYKEVDTNKGFEQSDADTEQLADNVLLEERTTSDSIDRRNSIINYNAEFGDQFQPISRDKHGQTLIHFAAARKNNRNALFQMLLEFDTNIAFRDELYRTARDIAVFSELYDNVKAVDAYVLHLAANGETDKILQLLMDGYDHILELESQESILDVVKERKHDKTLAVLETISLFEQVRDELHSAIRLGNKVKVKEILFKCGRDAKLIAACKNDTSRCCLHISVLSQQKDIVKYIAKKYPETLHIGDNLERTPLHYAMGLESVEELSSILIKAGAKRVVKDLKGRQPSYYFINKTEIMQMQQEEMFLRHKDYERR